MPGRRAGQSLFEWPGRRLSGARGEVGARQPLRPHSSATPNSTAIPSSVCRTTRPSVRPTLTRSPTAGRASTSRPAPLKERSRTRQGCTSPFERTICVVPRPIFFRRLGHRLSASKPDGLVFASAPSSARMTGVGRPRLGQPLHGRSKPCSVRNSPPRCPS